MKFLIQRVNHASVKVDGEITGEIGLGFLVLIGVSESDTREIADKMIKKLIGLRIFEDAEGKTNLALKDVGGSLLLVSQFTLYADCKKGNRPSFTQAGNPDKANELYEYVIEQCRAMDYPTATGIFGADMKINLENDGPFTIILDSRELLGDKL
ncbi:MAG: D-tyrosyl-tRNA(Tyr) deacylase [Lachnospiraceae bacterium]|uniref:D-aminoacyl-tRNA deacylase n=1 Tax=Roseburia sp. 1XD42-69 TaxID=2320088 RepID=UPI000EA3D8FA|nr:D-aminoacyl-tRNA deacylase [Roseburia sp. 1XD42-69]MCI8876976.1 D-tyrosyl-tRNA(Tyr) deacylase [Lachnospiraceae bacterium]RKJ65002.1 D-tyrosyl-tRNA(Tyr) deacylase [Roseburia sp. 1XD42-69]